MSFYILNLIFSVWGIFLYTMFRSSIYDYLRLSKVSKSYIRKKRKGIKNYWLYSAIHKERGLGYLYRLNIAYLCVWGVFTLVTATLGYLDFMEIPIIILAVALCAFELPSLIVFTKYEALTQYGVPFVWIAKNNGRRGYFYSSVINICLFGISLVILFFIVKSIV